VESAAVSGRSLRTIGFSSTIVLSEEAALMETQQAHCENIFTNMHQWARVMDRPLPQATSIGQSVELTIVAFGILFVYFAILIVYFNQYTMPAEECPFPPVAVEQDLLIFGNC
jgi:hypothetical protein